MVVGLALVWGALAVLGYKTGWELHAHHGQAALLGSARASLAHNASHCTTPSTPTSDGQLAGVLGLPKLDVTAPVEQGTNDNVLNVAVGHFDSSPFPGQVGTAVLLAHDVSYFADIDQLQPGDTIQYQVGCVTDIFKVTGHTVVAAGSQIPAQTGTALVLDTCWPTNALFFTPNRYLVVAQESSVLSGQKNASTGATPTNWQTGYTTPAPAALVAQGLDLTTNEAPMGVMQLTGTPNNAWDESPAPLAVEAAALAAYFGGLHAAAQHQSVWWADLAPGLAMPAPLSGAVISGHDSPLNVTITAQGDTPTAVQLSTLVTLSGGIAPAEYHEQVNEVIHGLTVVIANWELSRN